MNSNNHILGTFKRVWEVINLLRNIPDKEHIKKDNG